MRADRLVAVLLLMQVRGRVTAADVAAELQVSVATARRDLEALASAGVPVYPQPGRGGGWQLVGGARTDLSGLTAAEAQALFLLAGPAAVSPEARAALRKLMGALPRTFRTDAGAAMDATIVDPVRWGERDRPRPAMVDLLQTAVIRRRKVRLAYAGRTGAATERLVDPWGLIDKDDIWYLLADTDRGRRTFRVDRITRAEPTGLPAERPDDFTLAGAWQEVVDDIERRRSRTWATVLVEERFVPILRDQFGRHCHTDGEADHGRVRVRLAAPTPLDIARHLAGWGTLLDVVEPGSVRRELARIGAELAGRYTGDPEGQSGQDQASGEGRDR
ncbi:helix-turn-helix transcriptional regulator [Actinomadura citrea]|uniref:Putative DNA-binding transcriptional regulator YafY n=1 Tax=Actinomadura citrea TaxID=46158 RepID=A0A7Y9KFS0_9ACTN|nr:WYL domain-containing protein [Actinomadura citrea]NYE15895.1 putative DNA-binding transcriptional regulator YafY [Actinomadura citrea]GGT67878.1 transcriptional regulator [Actinomadura citrea]